MAESHNSGRGVAGRMTRWSAGRLKAIVSTPAVLLDRIRASRSEPAPVSLALVTVKTVSNRRDSSDSQAGRAVGMFLREVKRQPLGYDFLTIISLSPGSEGGSDTSGQLGGLVRSGGGHVPDRG